MPLPQNITARIAQEQEYSRLIDTANAPSGSHFDPKILLLLGTYLSLTLALSPTTSFWSGYQWACKRLEQMCSSLDGIPSKRRSWSKPRREIRDLRLQVFSANCSRKRCPGSVFCRPTRFLLVVECDFLISNFRGTKQRTSSSL